MIKKEDKPEFIGQIMDLFEDFLDEYGIKIPQKEGEESYDPDTPVNLCGKAYDDLAEQLEGFFRSWGVIKDERPQVEYLFILSLNGIKCEGTISVKAKDSDEAYRKAQDLAETELSSSFPSLDIPYDVEPIEEEGYPLYSIITEFLPFSTEQKVVSTSDKADADALFEKACRDNSAVRPVPRHPRQSLRNGASDFAKKREKHELASGEVYLRGAGTQDQVQHVETGSGRE